MIKVDETDPVGDVEPQFPYREVTIKRVNVNENFDLLDEIGRGKFGTVYKCKEKSTGLELAAKVISVPNRKERRNVQTEIDMMNALKHPKIIQLYDAYEYDKMICVVLELIEGGELFDRVLDDKFILTEKACGIFIRQICEALDFMHDKNVIHLDLKPENILCLTEAGNRIKIIDFGLAREYDPDKKLQVLFGTPEFVAPEVVNFDRITFATDMWSVGVIAYVLVSGLSPFAGDTDVDTMANVTIGKYDFLDEAFDTVSPECIDFIQKLLVKEHGDRLTAKEALRHKWVKRKPRYHPMNSQPSHPLAFKGLLLDKNNELTSAKDNLKDFVNRWNDSSTYVFDKDSNMITPVQSTISASIGLSRSSSQSGSLSSSSEFLNKNANDEDFLKPKSSSSPVALVLDLNSSIQDNSNNINNPLDLSPSSQSIISQKLPEPDPKPSVDTTTQIQSNITPQVFENVSLKDYLQSFEFERRNSDSTLVVNKNPSTTSKINLLQEIKKLTDYLFKIKNQEPKERESVEQQQEPEDDQKILEQAKTIEITKTIEHEQKNKEHEMNLKNSEHTHKIEVKIESNNQDKSDDDKENVTADSKSKETENLTPSTKSRNITELFKKFTNMTDKDENKDKANIARWPVSNKRTKFRINQMSSRDVPIFKVPASQHKLQKQNAIITSETLFQEKIIKPVSQQSSLDSTELMRRFPQDSHPPHTLFQQHHIYQKENMKKSQRFFTEPHSISFELGSLSQTLEQRAFNSITSFFQLHAKQTNSNSTVKQIQKQIESKNK